MRSAGSLPGCCCCCCVHRSYNTFLLLIKTNFFSFPLLPSVWPKFRKPKRTSAKRRNKSWTKFCSPTFTIEESVHQAPMEQVCKSFHARLPHLFCFRLQPPPPTLCISTDWSAVNDFQGREWTRMSACIPFPPPLSGVYWSELGSYVRGHNQYFQKEKKKLQRSTGRQQAFFSLTSSIWLSAGPTHRWSRPSWCRVKR